jgi:hypothetical protein
MEDLDIAKGLLSTILNVEIIELSFQPQETISENTQVTKTIRVYRIDFAAIVKQTDGQTKKVLIELQKTKRNTNAIRFRRYLGENYQKEDTIIDTNGKERKRPLEIITIYILGFPLNKTLIRLNKILIFDLISSTEAPNIKAIMITKNTNPTRAKPIANGIQRGEVTHHQDQSIFPVSFNTKNTTNKTPGSPIPFDVFFFILYFL